HAGRGKRAVLRLAALRRLHDYHRGLRARPRAATSANAGTDVDEDRHVMTAARTARRKSHPSRTPLIGRRRPAASHCASLLAHKNRRPTPRRPFRSSSCPPTPCCPSLPPHPVPPVHHPRDACCGQIPIGPAAAPLFTKRDFVP